MSGNNLMLLDYQFRPDNSDIWREAIRRGWKTERTDPYKIEEHIKGFDFVRYYGNTLHVKLIEDKLPFKLLPVEYSWLAKLNDYTKRNIRYIKYSKLKQPIEEVKFIKPARDKFFEYKVFQIGDIISGSPLPDDYIYISDVVKFSDEVRCFVLNGEILTSSLYRINQTVWDKSEEKPEDINFDSRINDTPIPAMVKEIAAKMGKDLPNGVVIDFGLLENTTDDYLLIEFNEAWASGLYYCDVEKCFDVICSSQQ